MPFSGLNLAYVLIVSPFIRIIKSGRWGMKIEMLVTVLLLLLPAAAWAPTEVPEPGVLPLLVAGGVIAVALKVIKRMR